MFVYYRFIAAIAKTNYDSYFGLERSVRWSVGLVSGSFFNIEPSISVDFQARSNACSTLLLSLIQRISLYIYLHRNHRATMYDLRNNHIECEQLTPYHIIMLKRPIFKIKTDYVLCSVMHKRAHNIPHILFGPVHGKWEFSARIWCVMLYPLQQFALLSQNCVQKSIITYGFPLVY